MLNKGKCILNVISVKVVKVKVLPAKLNSGQERPNSQCTFCRTSLPSSSLASILLPACVCC